MLTKGLDNIVGTAGNDTITGSVDSTNAELNTMSPIDVVNGGDGTDTFKIAAATALTTASLATISNVETIELAASDTMGTVGVNDLVNDATNDGDATPTAAFDVSNVTGLTTLNVTKATSTSIKAAATTDVSVAGATGGIEVNGGKNVTITDAANGNHITVGSTVVAAADDTNTAGTAAAGTITVTDSKQNAGIIQVDGGTDVTVTTSSTVDNGGTAVGALKAASGTVSVTANLNGDGTATLDQGDITVKGGTAVTVASTLTINAKDQTAGAAHTLGDVTVTGDGKTTSVTVNQTYAETEFTKAAVAVVKETSVVTFAELKQGETLIINGLTFTAAKDLTAEQAAAAFASLTDADTQTATGPTANGLFAGTFTTGWTSAAVSGKTVTFTAKDEDETDLTFTGTAATKPTQVKAAGTIAAAAVTSANTITYGTTRVDDVAAAAITTVTLNGYSTADLGNTGTDLNALTTLSLTNGGAVELATSATTLGLTLNKVSGAVDIDNTAATVTALNVTTATADSASALVAAAVKDLTVAGTNSLDITGATMGALETVVVSGSAGLNLGAVTASKSITTTTTGKVTATINAGVATYTGGDGVDDVTTVTTAAPSKAISLGGGDDKVTLLTGTTSIAATGSINGGTGTNTLSMVAANAVTASQSTAFATKVTNFQKLVLTGATGAQELESDVLGNFNDVEVKGAIDGALTLDGVTTGATIRLNDNSNIQTIAMVTDAGLVANSADTLNIVIGASGENGGVDSNGIVRADDVEKFNISVTDISVVQTPIDTKADAQSLTLNATKATTITITGNTALTLNTALNQKVTAINAADFTGALTVTAAGGVATTITGGTGADHLTASTGAIAGTNNATGSSAVITNDVTSGADGVTKEVATVVLTDGTYPGLTLGDTMSLKVEGTTYTYTATAATETMDAAGTALAALIQAGGLVTSASYTAGTNTLAITALTALTANIAISEYAITDAAGGASKGDTLLGGDGADTLTAGTLATLTGGAGNDTFIMVKDLVNINSYSSITDFLAGDKIDTSGTNFKSSGVALASTAVFSDFVNAAIAQTSNGDVIWFQKDGNTYVVENGTAGTATTFNVAQDYIIQIVGLKDLSTASFNTGNGFLEMA